ncbi:MAG: endolytic transglycosylase MltG [Candidatus Wolfebacteria bacterium]|nr:endolytic transglycosylase MltG [Candidatus Wolfebacteria bacterium]
MDIDGKKILIGFLGLAFFVAAAAFFYFSQPTYSQSQAPGADAKRINFEVKLGDGIKEIAAGLKKENLLKSEGVFWTYAILTGEAQSLKPGNYSLSSDFSALMLVSALSRGPEDVSVTIFPGETVAEIDDKVSSLGVLQEGELKNFNPDSLGSGYDWFKGLFKGALTKKPISGRISVNEDNKLEGFLFPDTYYFSPKSDAKTVTEKFLDNFKGKTSVILGKNDDLFRTIIIASILEKETPDYKDKSVVAGILEKRLAMNMPLQVDCSISYLSCSGKYLDCSINRADYKTDSPYNTYTNVGLPPGPISNPGIESIMAALNPQKSTPFLYYLSDSKTKKTIFSETFDEHNDNRNKYLLSD